MENRVNIISNNNNNNNAGDPCLPTAFFSACLGWESMLSPYARPRRDVKLSFGGIGGFGGPAGSHPAIAKIDARISSFMAKVPICCLGCVGQLLNG